MNSQARSSIDTLLTTLKESLGQPGRSLLPLLTSMSHFAKYSLVNQLLIFTQRPDATYVMGYRAWHKAGYQVRKGEHGIAIYAPRRTLPTNRPPLAWVTAAPTVTDSATANRFLEGLKTFLVGHNVELEYKALQPGLLAYTNGRRITCGIGQASHVEFATLVHETTHVL